MAQVKKLSLEELVKRFLKSSPAPQLTDVSSANVTVRLLARLASMHAWARIVEVTQRLPEALDAATTAQFRMFRLAALLRTRHYKVAQAEVAAYAAERSKAGAVTAAAGGDKDAKSGPDGAALPSPDDTVLPLGLRVAMAQVPHYCGSTHTSVDALCALLAELKRAFEAPGDGGGADGDAEAGGGTVASLGRADIVVWRARIACAVSQLLAGLGSYESAARICERVLDSHGGVTGDVGALGPSVTLGRVILASQVGRVYLLVGNVAGAERAFAAAASALSSGSGSGSAGSGDGGGGGSGGVADRASASVIVNLNAAMLDVARGSFRSALARLEGCSAKAQAAHKAASAASGVPSMALQDGLDCMRANVVAITNNMAVCALHECQAERAVTLLEALVKDDPARCLTEAVTSNLCVLYELARTPPKAKECKQVLRGVSHAYGLTHLHDSVFRL